MAPITLKAYWWGCGSSCGLWGCPSLWRTWSRRHIWRASLRDASSDESVAVTSRSRTQGTSGTSEAWRVCGWRRVSSGDPLWWTRKCIPGTNIWMGAHSSNTRYLIVSSLHETEYASWGCRHAWTVSCTRGTGISKSFGEVVPAFLRPRKTIGHYQ